MARRNSGMRLKVEGAEEVIRALKKADAKMEKELRDLISQAAEIVFREADARAPIGPTGRTRFSIRMEIGESKRGNFYANVVVGAQKGESTSSSAFYVTFYELGNSRQPPRPFMRPAMDKSKAKVRKLLKEGLERVINGLGSGPSA